MAAWYRWQADDLILQVKVIPRASADSLEPTTDRLKIKITVPPIDGKANKHLIKARRPHLAKTFKVAASNISIERGQNQTLKTLRIIRSKQLISPIVFPKWGWQDTMIKLPLRWLLLALTLISAHGFAETIQWQGYDIHYTTFKSTLIPPEVAAAHNIKRSNRRIVTNISVRLNDTAVAATITGHTTNLLNQLFHLEFDEVREPSAIYYLTNLIVDEVDTLRFTLEIKPEGSDVSYPLKFTRKYF